MSYFADDLSMNTNFLQELLLSVFRKTRKLVKKKFNFQNQTLWYPGIVRVYDESEG